MTALAPFGGLTWRHLRDLDLGGVEDAAAGWGTAARQAETSRDRVDREMLARLRAGQRGEARQAALRRLRRLRENFDYIRLECGLVRTTLSSLAAELRPLQRNVRRALREAETAGFTVRHDGSVSYPSAGTATVPGLPPAGGTARSAPLLTAPSPFTAVNPHHAAAQDIADTLADAQRRARHIDAEYAQALHKLKARPGLGVSDAMWADAARDTRRVRTAIDDLLGRTIPLNASPAERLRWWQGLSEFDRRQYLTLCPDIIGNLDGIPATVRDEANRARLPLLMTRLAASDDPQAREQLEALRIIDRKLREGGEPPMYLLGLSDEGNGRAIVSYGNPDTSKNVSAYVPGLGTALDTEFATSTLDRAQSTALGARDFDPSSASIVWLGYDAPQSADVMSSADALAGAPRYNEFMSGLAATNENPDPHMTAIGHSYGSLTVGQAAMQRDGIPHADDIVLLGSPGTGAKRAEDLNIDPDHVYVGAAKNDLVTNLPTRSEAAALALGPAPGMINALLFKEEEVWFGTDPASEEFGARRFTVSNGPSPVTIGEDPFTAHSNYFNPNKDPESSENLARIVSGRGSEVTQEERR